VDNVQGARLAVEHLIRLGHRRIGMITNAPTTYVAAHQRLEGYRQALDGAGLPYDEHLVRYGNFDEQSGEVAMRELLAATPPPTAVFVASDMVALGALKAIWDQGLRVPEDVALVGFDDITTARFTTPPLTTVHVPALRLGEEAGKVLLDVMEFGFTTRSQVLLQTTLVVRASCGATTSR
ncbi:LacI family transcriptional regulator, partial [Candidatus Parcubacteria bacterium]